MEGTDDKPRAEVAGELCRGAKEEKELKNERCDAVAELSEDNPSAPTKPTSQRLSVEIVSASVALLT